MAKSGISNYRAFHDLTKILLTIGGLWPYSNSNILYRLLSYVQGFLSLGMTLVVFGFILENFSNVALVTRGLNVMTSFTSAVLKVVCLILKHREMEELHKNLDPYFEKLLENEKMLEHILKKVNIFRLLSGVLTLTVFAVIAFQIIAPLIFIINCKVHHVEIKKYPLIYPGNYPWNISASGSLYLAHFTLETFGTFALFFVTTSVDSLFTLYNFQIIGQLREMSYYITHIDSDDDSGKYIFHRCIIQHQKLIKCVKLMKAIYGPVVLWMMSTNAIVLCALLFQISKVKTITIIQSVMFTPYVILQLLQTFIYAWCGSCLTEESENYKYAVYSANWYGNRILMSSVVIIITQKPLAITIFNSSTLSSKENFQDYFSFFETTLTKFYYTDF
ncbi:GSCOCT00013826001.3-RA-CDS [Cotesia congregata]|uniref:Odorant receptor n=1 Tax=Cotesia congregata TaxID=51543 RepID=A0A8J2MTU4_COTCN|nr:GSCOCT00013826001.3-RA-CDS [Cotesia congregata]CAG5109176.1 olfactory receptor 120 [Cotesia congregata]